MHKSIYIENEDWSEFLRGQVGVELGKKTLVLGTPLLSRLHIINLYNKL